jgi:glycosyltransferase involved in cell wall biosynthesis
MRLAFVTVGDTARKVGGHRYNARMISGLRARGVEVEEIVASEADAESQRAASAFLGERFAPEEFDAISVDALARVVCTPHLDRWREKTPVAALVHELPSVAGSDGNERDMEEPLLRSERLICVSRHGASILEERGVPPSRIHVVHPGLDRDAGVAPAESGDQPPKVLCVAQWIPRKNILGLVRAWRLLEGSGHGATLELVGETDADPAYAARVRDAISGAEDIIVRGPVDDEELSLTYAGASVFALPSLYEGYGMVYAEAMSCGLPIIAPDRGPVPEIIGDAGLLVEPGHETGISEALLALISAPELRLDLSRKALSRAASLPSWSETVDGFLAALRAAVPERSRV